MAHKKHPQCPQDGRLGIPALWRWQARTYQIRKFQIPHAAELFANIVIKRKTGNSFVFLMFWLPQDSADFPPFNAGD